MNAGWNELESLTDAYIAKSAEPVTRERAMAAVMKTEAGRRAYARYASGPHASTLAGIAEEELAIKAARLVRESGGRVEKADAVDEVMQRFPELARLANGGRAEVAKSEGAYGRIEKAAEEIAEKHGISKEAAEARYLQTEAGKRDYAAYRAERMGA